MLDDPWAWTILLDVDPSGLPGIASATASNNRMIKTGKYLFENRFILNNLSPFGHNWF